MVAPTASWMPIRELSRRTGVSCDLLRKWERRYGVLTPQRTVGNQRLYSQVDEARVRLMVGHVHDGMAAAQAAELARGATFRISTTGAAEQDVEEAVAARAEMLAALERFDETAAERVIERLMSRVAPIALVRDIYLPLLRELGERWAQERTSIAQEHFASGVIQARLLGLARGWDRGLGPRAVLACPAGEQHTLGLIAFGIALHRLGWRVTYLGADAPWAAVAEGARQVRAALVVLSATDARRLLPLQGDIDRLLREIPVALGGAGADAVFAAGCGARYLAGDPITAAIPFTR